MRRFWQVTDRAGTNRWLIPPGNYSEQLDVAQRTNLVSVMGRDGAFDVHGDRRSPRAHGEASLSFTVIEECAADTERELQRMFSAANGAVLDQGLRKVWRLDDTDQSGLRFTWARLATRPQMTRDVFTRRHMIIALKLLLPDPLFYTPLTRRWLTDNGYDIAAVAEAVVGEPIAPDLLFATYSFAAGTQPFTILNDGDRESRRVIFRITAGGGSLSAVTVTNTTTGYTFTTNTIAAGKLYSVNASPGLGRARKSDDGGTTWIDQTRFLVLPTDQPELMLLAPGSNAMEIVCPDALTLDVNWLSAAED